MYKPILPLLLMLLLPCVAAAQQQSPDYPAKAEAMKKLEFLTGSWQGSGWIEFGGRKSEFVGSEDVKYKIDGLAVLIEGLHKIKLPDGSERVIHSALGIITYDPQTESYAFNAHLANGRSGNYSAKLIDDSTLQWMLPDSPVGKMRYTIKIDGATWLEIGEVARDGEQWTQFFEMKLARDAQE